jgi:Methyltransferase domain
MQDDLPLPLREVVGGGVLQLVGAAYGLALRKLRASSIGESRCAGHAMPGGADMRISGMVNKLLRLFGRQRPLTYRDIVPSYAEYASLQKNRYCSFESEVPRWETGQKRFIERQFTVADRDRKILDIACGDGVGLRCFRALGFADVTGIEFNPAKAERARRAGYPVLCLDMHDLSDFKGETFDYV